MVILNNPSCHTLIIHETYLFLAVFLVILEPMMMSLKVQITDFSHIVTFVHFKTVWVTQ